MLTSWQKGTFSRRNNFFQKNRKKSINGFEVQRSPKNCEKWSFWAIFVIFRTLDTRQLTEFCSEAQEHHTFSKDLIEIFQENKYEIKLEFPDKFYRCSKSSPRAKKCRPEKVRWVMRSYKNGVCAPQ